jgi:outer membrane protein
MMKKLAIALAVATLAPVAMAQSAGDVLVRFRAVDLLSANDNNTALKSTLSSLGSSEASINDKWLPEVDFTYFITPNIAAELILTYPQKQTLSATNVGSLGTFKHLPPTLTAQYHFTGLPYGIKPYLGAGVNYTNISDVNLSATGQALGLSVKRNSFCLALQAGVDVAIDKVWSVNLDVKKVQIETTVSSNGTEIGKFGVNPLLIGVGVGYKFSL